MDKAYEIVVKIISFKDETLKGVVNREMKIDFKKRQVVVNKYSFVQRQRENL